MSTSQPCARRCARSARVAFEPGSRIRSASPGSASPARTMTTVTSGSARKGSRSSKLAMRESTGTATRIAPGLAASARTSPEPTSNASSRGRRAAPSNQGTTPKSAMPVRSATMARPSSNRAGSPRNLLTTKPRVSARSASDSRFQVPTSCAITPPRSISPIRTTGTFAASANPILAISAARRLTSAALPAPSTTTMSACAVSRPKLSTTVPRRSGFMAW